MIQGLLSTARPSGETPPSSNTQVEAQGPGLGASGGAELDEAEEDEAGAKGAFIRASMPSGVKP